MTERTLSLREGYILAAVGVPILLIYGVAQSMLALFIAPKQPELKLVVEPYLLLIGLILHVQWRRVARTFREHGLTRPAWVAAADCLSFVITFWAIGVLVEAFLKEAGII